ncbi:MAG: ELWxxDGT repeat protein [Thermoanaerobaculia bacterium]
MRTLALCALLALLALPAAGLEPYLVKDLDLPGEPLGSDPRGLATLGGAVLFFASDGISGDGRLSGRQLWRSDGTTAGTWQVTREPFVAAWNAEPYAVTERLLFLLDEPGNLWASDGTTAGTLALTEGVKILPSRVWMASQGVLCFAGQDSGHGAELWVSDGTPAGTHLVADIHEGAASSGPRWLTEYRGRVWFGAVDGRRGGALWVSDGTAAGTVPAIDPLPSAWSKPPEHIQVLGDRLTFFARAPGPSRALQLWAGDGTRAGTAPVTRLSGSFGPRNLYDSMVWDGRLWFVAEERTRTRNGQELWVSDGTPRGTRPLTRFANEEAFFSNAASWSLPQQQGLPGLFFFAADDDGDRGADLRVTDGTPQGTRRVLDACTGACTATASPWFALLAGRLYFSAGDGEHGVEPWSTDGTAAGTRRVIDLCPGPCSSYPADPFRLGDRLLFTAQDGEIGQDIWSTDGTAEGTVRISDFPVWFNWFISGYHEFHGAVLDGQLLFNAVDRGPWDWELWRTDGTAAGTRLVANINPVDRSGSSPQRLQSLGSQVVFSTFTGEVRVPALWKSDGTAAGTVRFKTFSWEELEGANREGSWTEAGGLLFYLGRRYADGRHLPWRTDGTDAGTFRLTDASVPACCALEPIRAVGSTVFLSLEDAEHGRELWASDGTPEGTRLVRDVLPGAGSSEPRELTAFQGRLFFSATDPDAGPGLWASDGTEAGTARVADVADPVLLTVHAGRLWFFTDGEHGPVLWSSDGTAAGTVPAVGFEARFEEKDEPFRPDRLVSIGGRLVISFGDGGLWATDGTPAGSGRIHELGFRATHAGDAGTVFQDRFYYVATDVANAVLWVTDGTAAGTRQVLDRDGATLVPVWLEVLGDHLVIAVQAGSDWGIWQSDGTPAGTFRLEPRVFPTADPARAGDRIFFPGYDPVRGSELWAVRP